MSDSDSEIETNSLPKQFALKSQKKDAFLRYTPGLTKLRGYVQFTGKDLVSPYGKFEVENSKTRHGYVHIRCCYNNKYLVRASESSFHIVATAKEPEEDKSKFSCTLFKPTFHADHHDGFSFLHLQLGRKIHLDFTNEEFKDCLIVSDDNSNSNSDSDYFSTVIAWNSLFILPKHVAFKGNNGRYLRPAHYRRTVYLEFSGGDAKDSGVRHQIFTTPDGHVRIKTLPYGKFWRRDPNWIWADTDASESSVKNPNTLFWPVRIGNTNVVALRCKANNRFCANITLDGKKNCLNASDPTITAKAKMEVTEIVVSRAIYNIHFRLSDSRIYDEKPLVITSGTVENGGTEEETSSVKLSYEDTMISLWDSSASFKIGAKVKIETGIPKVTSGEVEVSVEMTEEYTWGASKQTKSLVEVVCEVEVLPSTKVKSSIIATQGTCDVPFSYTQRDTLADGKIVTRRYDDGVYTSVNCYNYQILIEGEDI